MSAAGWAASVLLAVGVAVELLCCVGILVHRDPFDQLHFLGPATTVGTVLVVAAVLVAAPGFVAGAKAVLLGIVILATGPVLTHATGRAAHVRLRGDLLARPSEVAGR